MQSIVEVVEPFNDIVVVDEFAVSYFKFVAFGDAVGLIAVANQRGDKQITSDGDLVADVDGKCRMVIPVASNFLGVLVLWWLTHEIDVKAHDRHIGAVCKAVIGGVQTL